LIVPWEPDDVKTLDACMRIWLSANQQAHAFVPPGYWQSHYKAVKQNGLPNSQVFCAWQNGQVQGFVGVVENYIAGLFVQPGHQNQGVGTRLLEYCKAQYQALSLHVFEQNARAVRFYLKNGFFVCSRAPCEPRRGPRVTAKYHRGPAKRGTSP